MKFKRTDDLLNNTELLEGAAASPDAPVTSSEEAAMPTESLLYHNRPARKARGATKMRAVGSHLQRMEELSGPKACLL